MKILRGYKVALDPNDVQRTAFSRHAGAARWAYNWGIYTWKRLYEERKVAIKGTGEKIGKVTDAINKMTTEIVRAKRPSVIVLEDLNVAGMEKNHCLARSVSDAAFGEARRQFTYKALWNGVEVVSAHRFFPSTKRCSACGVVRVSVGLGERVFSCPSCGFTAGRDENASYNLRDYPSLDWKPKITASSAGSARGGAVRPDRSSKGESVRLVPLKREVDSRVVSA